MKKTILAIIFAFLLTSSFCGCGKNQETKEFNGVPDRVISRSRQTEPAVTPVQEQEPDITVPSDDEQQISDTDSDVPPITVSESDVSQQTVSESKNSKPSSSSSKSKEDKKTQSTEPTADDDVSIDEMDDENQGETGSEDDVSLTEQDTMAMDYLKLLNSSKVHAVLTEAESMDKLEISSVEREYFIDGKNAVYINDHQKIIMTADTVTVIDTEENTYYTYPRDGEEGEVFGYNPAGYELQSIETDDNGNVIEIYSVSAGRNNIKSTWTFSPDGKITVMDESVEFGSFRWYRFDVISKDISGMDMTIPDGLELIEPEDIM